MYFLGVRRVVRALNIPTNEWYYNAYAVCKGILSKQLITSAELICGKWTGPIDCGAIRQDNNHYWIETSYDEIVDPTSWAFFVDKDPIINFLYPIKMHNEFYFKSDVDDKKCPPMIKNGKRIRLFIHNKKLKELLHNLTKYNESCTINVLSWICRQNTNIWGDDLVDLYDGIIRSGFEYLIPNANLDIYNNIIGDDVNKKLREYEQTISDNNTKKI